nr:O-antigen ligase family protein [Hyphomonas sp. Mor2]
MVLWPIIAYMGAQGYTGAVAIAALLGLVYVRVREVRVYALALIAFVGWIVAAQFWGPEAKALFVGDVREGSFSMDMPGIRFGLTALAGLGVIVATSTVAADSSRISLGVIVGVAMVQFVGVVMTALFTPQILALLAWRSDPVLEMPQNLIRNANAFMLLLPFLLAWMWHRATSDYWRMGAMALGVISVAAFAQTGTQTGLTGAALMLICMTIIKLWPKNGFRIILSSLAVYVTLAPLLLGWGVAQLRSFGVPLPQSFFSRTYSWELVREKVGEAPFMGHGLEASYTWTDTYGDHPDWLADAVARYHQEVAFAWEGYPIVPGHPHNMPLQVWAETGMIGASLAAIFLFFLGWRLKAPQDWSPITRNAAAGLIGVNIAVCSFAYSMWNEAFWASSVLAAAVILLQARHDGEVQA